ncbi:MULTISPECIES: glucose 1-dehydrogenase [unclassified Leptolyngbya]|uniref:glucose 1-dehydrogenase n=1 Tax=unclassified Leptolyngbya TaxID=2650499 RepID=UPI001682BE3B|nr:MULTISPECIES: glucose 1-dehydrogenase [unclassified Leptolyngbya]MBD1911731.1 SDR family oxidoreductase [Leptolyngbya sp. FACHB-8]MBD2157330.1 SDR family oxidoreductase [Leptolyngbya sp. FACHB-16]
MNAENRVAIVTGGGQGIGKATVLKLLQAGYRVAIAEIDSDAGTETAEEYSSLGEARFIPTDVSDEASVRQLVTDTIAAYHRLDVLVNNAAIAHPNNAPVEELDLVQWNRIITTNLTSAFLTSKYAIPHLRACRGSIINIASTRAFMSEPHTEAYSASKGGIVALTHALANSLGPDIRVNCISPGWIAVEDWKKAANRGTPQLTEQDHQQHPAGRVGVPDDVAAMVVYLASEAAGFMTGENFIIDGGMTRKMIYL